MDNRPEDRNPTPRLSDLYRLQYIDRWHIVKTEERQSVADHSCMVAMICAFICDALGLGKEGKMRIVYNALFHDSLECYAGDIATPVKKFIKGDELKNSLPKCPTPGVFDQDIIKLADLAESIKFLVEHGKNKHSCKIRERITTAFNSQLINNKHHWPEYPWNRAEKVIEDFLYGYDETFIDDYI